MSYFKAQNAPTFDFGSGSTRHLTGFTGSPTFKGKGRNEWIGMVGEEDCPLPFPTSEILNMEIVDGTSVR